MKTFIKYLIFGLVSTGLFASCSDTSAPISSNSDEDDPVNLNEPLEKLPGDDNENILNATFDFSTPSEATQEEVSTVESNGVEQRILRTEIDISLKSSATVRQINDFLEAYDAKIVEMLEGINTLLVVIEDPGDIESLNSIMEQVESEEIVEFVVKSALIEDPIMNPGSEENPKKIPSHINDTTHIDHQLAIRGHGAWNLRNAIAPIDQRPWLIVADFFGDGAPGNGYNAVLRTSDFSSGNTNIHGYHVLGIALGKYDKESLLNEDQNDVTGIFPEQLNVRVLDIQGISQSTWDEETWSRVVYKIINLIRDIHTKAPETGIILSTSLNSRSIDSLNKAHAQNWIYRLRGFDNLEDKFIHFTSSGNVGDDGVIYPAKDNSMFALAGLEDITFGSFSARKLTNTFVVENRVISIPGENMRPQPGCAHTSSIMGGNLSGIGTNVYSFGECRWNILGLCVQHRTDPFTSKLTGTSMSTPQAAGVAAYVWAVNPDLSVAGVMDIIRNTAEEISTTNTAGYNCNSEVSQPVIDAYAAVLAAGGENARRVLLDVNEDGVFDEADIEMLMNKFGTKNGNLDYSRYDLNGSGRTGGSSTERFDLNNNMSYENLTKTIEETEVEFDEWSITDQEILCYYAYSDLFDGDLNMRSEILNKNCAESTDTGDNGDWHRDTETEVVDVYNPATGKTWMDRNLGASRAATSSSDEQAYGDLYQWGRAADGHEKLISSTTVNRSSTDQPGHGDFIVTSSRPYDWRNPHNDNLWQGINGINNPCPIGYRLPTEEEWEDERRSWSSNDADGAFASPLKLPLAGRQGFSSHSPSSGGSGYYASGTASDGHNTIGLFIGSFDDSATMFGGARATGRSVRCIKD